MKILLLGANGQLGTAFQELSRTEAFPLGWTLMALSSKDCDLKVKASIEAALSRVQPDVIINAAAYTAVDLAEKEQEACDAINATAPKLLAEYCKAHGVPLVHYSSDYVYSGEGSEPRNESAPIAPLNVYGASKAKGDEAIAKAGCDYLIFRTSWVFSHVGKNFVKTMLRLGAERPELRVVDDQVGSPTYAPDLAKYSLEALMRSLEKKAAGMAFPTGVYHLANSGTTSWAGFARAILPKTKVTGILSAEYPTPAKRPLNSRLSLKKFTTVFGLKPRSWQESLQDCLTQLKEPTHG